MSHNILNLKRCQEEITHWTQEIRCGTLEISCQVSSLGVLSWAESAGWQHCVTSFHMCALHHLLKTFDTQQYFVDISLQWPSFNHRNLPEILGKFYPKSVSRMRSKGFSFVFVGPGGGVLASRLSNRNNSQRRRSGCVAGNALFCVAGVALCDIRRVWSCVGIFGVTGAIFLNGLDRMTFIFRSTRST